MPIDDEERRGKDLSDCLVSKVLSSGMKYPAE
jgi:hypothetical protein